VATQALFLMNSPFVEQRARQTVDRVFAIRATDAVVQQVDNQQDGEEAARVRALYLRALNRPAEPHEMADAIAFVEQFKLLRADLPNPPADLTNAAWAEFCRALFASNDFLFLE
jgi:hypothetical protein